MSNLLVKLKTVGPKCGKHSSQSLHNTTHSASLCIHPHNMYLTTLHVLTRRYGGWPAAYKRERERVCERECVWERVCEGEICKVVLSKPDNKRTRTTGNCNWYRRLFTHKTLDPSVIRMRQFRINWPVLWQGYLHLLAVSHCCIPFLKSENCVPRSVHWQLTTLRENSPFIFYSMLAPSLPSHSLRSNDGSTLSVPRVKVKANAGARQSCDPSLWNDLLLSVPQPL